MVLTNEMKNEKGKLIYEMFVFYCNQLGFTRMEDACELLGAVTMFFLQGASDVLGVTMEELREDYVDSLNNAYFEKQ